SDSMMIVLLDWAHKPVGVQFVLPDHATIGLPRRSTRTANLLWPIWAELLNMRFCSRSPISCDSRCRAPAFVVSQTICFWGLSPVGLDFAADFVFVADFVFFADLDFEADLDFDSGLDFLVADLAAAAAALPADLVCFEVFPVFFSALLPLAARAGPLPAVDKMRCSRS